MAVKVFIEGMLYDEKTFTNEEEAVMWASYMQDAGYKVRIVEEVMHS